MTRRSCEGGKDVEAAEAENPVGQPGGESPLITAVEHALREGLGDALRAVDSPGLRVGPSGPGVQYDRDGNPPGLRVGPSHGSRLD